MRHGIVEGEPGSMPWGQWWLRKVIRGGLRAKPRDRQPESEADRSLPDRAAGKRNGKGEGTPTT